METNQLIERARRSLVNSLKKYPGMKVESVYAYKKVLDYAHDIEINDLKIQVESVDMGETVNIREGVDAVFMYHRNPPSKKYPNYILLANKFPKEPFMVTPSFLRGCEQDIRKAFPPKTTV